MALISDPKTKCPATGFKSKCSTLAACCPKFVTIRGRDPQTGVETDRSGCVDSFLPMLLIENAQVSRQTGAAVETLRNEVAKDRVASEDARQQALHALGGTQRRISG